MASGRLVVTGDQELIKNLHKINNAMLKSVAVKGGRAGAKVFKKQVQDNILRMLGRGAFFKSGKMNVKGTKEISDFRNKYIQAIQNRPKKGRQRPKEYLIKTWIDPDAEDMVYFAKDPSNSKYKSGRTYIPSAIEYGHDKVLWGRRTKGFVPPIPVFRAAFDDNGKANIQVIAEAMKSQIKVVLYKYRGKQFKKFLKGGKFKL